MVRGFWVVVTAGWFALGVGLANTEERTPPQEVRPTEQNTVPEFSIGGVVLDSATRQPVGHVLVALTMYGDPRASNGERPMRRVMTGDDGRFEIAGLTETGRAGIDASKPGYFSTRQIRTAARRTMGAWQEVNLAPGLNVTVTLTPEAIIAGRVADENGAPIENLPVHLAFEGAEEGKRRMFTQPPTFTNEEGEFRFAELRSGRYFVSAGPSDEVASREGARGRAALGYAEVFYGGGNDFASATAIDLTPGKRAEVDLRLALQPLLRVTGFYSGKTAPGRPDLEIYNGANQQVVQVRQQSSDHEFEIGPLPAGPYTIRAKAVDTEKGECVATAKRLNLRTDVTGLQLALAPCATITANLHVERTKNERNSSVSVDQGGFVRANQGYIWQLLLLPKDERTHPTYRARPEKENPDVAIFRGVEPGRYSVEGQLMRGAYVESIRSGMSDLLQEDLVVAPGAEVAPIEVHVRDDSAQLNGKVKIDADIGAAAVIAIPENMPRGAKTAFVVNGQYRFPPLAPGTYQLVAVDRVDDFAYAERDEMNRHMTHAKEVTLRPNESASVDLEFVKVGREEQQ